MSAPSSAFTSFQNAASIGPGVSFSFLSPFNVLLTFLEMPLTTSELLWKLFERMASWSCTSSMKCEKAVKRHETILLRSCQRESLISRSLSASVVSLSISSAFDSEICVRSE